MHPLESALGYAFQDVTWLDVALHHRSRPRGREDDRSGERHNERLEFLGDAVLDLVIRTVLYERFPNAPEGSLTRWRSYLASRERLATIARRLRVDAHLCADLPPTNGHPAQEERVLADAVEAVFGAVYRDSDYGTARNVIASVLEPDIVSLRADRYHGNYKGALQEFWQKETGLVPQYDVSRISGPAHAPLFEMTVRLGDDCGGDGTGWSKREASQRAAHAALRRLRDDPDWKRHLLRRYGRHDGSDAEAAQEAIVR